MDAHETGQRLEMLLVMRWLDAGAADDGEVALSVAEAAAELGLEEDRRGLLEVMAGLGELESRGAVTVAWSSGARREARVALASDLRRDARRLFGRASP